LDRRFLLLAAVCAAGFADPAFARHRELNVGLITQQSPVWCWAASASMALKYLGFPDINPVRNYQCGVVAAAFPDCEYDCTRCETPLDRMSTFVALLERYRERTKHSRPAARQLSLRPNYVAYPEFDRIKRSINLSYPVIGGVSVGRRPVNPAEAQHAVLITGYDDDYRGTGERWVVVMDPFPYAGGESPWLHAGYSARRSTGKLMVPWRVLRDRMNLSSAVFLEDRSA